MSLVIFSAVDHLWTEEGDGIAPAARTAVRSLVSRAVPLVLISRHGASDVLSLQARLGIRHPFVCSGGAALYVPAGYFPELRRIGSHRDGWNVVEFKLPHDTAPGVRLLVSLYKLCGTQDAMIVGLGERWSDRVLMRESDAAVIVASGTADETRLRQMLPAAYVTLTQGAAGWSEAILGSVPE
jgi:predicted mannosyl-3-phosphoglycerate phosphatase (HAD superfamily)